MKSVIVTFTIPGENNSINYDLEIPSNVPCGFLVVHIAQTVNNYNRSLNVSPTGKSLFSNRLKRKLNPEETFETAGIWNGDYITFA